LPGRVPVQDHPTRAGCVIAGDQTWEV